MARQIKGLADDKEEGQPHHPVQFEVDPLPLHLLGMLAQLQQLTAEGIALVYIDLPACRLGECLLGLEVEIGDVEVGNTHRGEKGDPAKVKATPYLFGCLDGVGHHALNDGLLANKLATEEDHGKQPVDGGWLPHKESPVLQQQGGPTQHRDESQGDEVHLFKAFVFKPEGGDLYKRRGNRYRCGGVHAIELVGDKEEKNRKEVEKEFHQFSVASCCAPASLFKGRPIYHSLYRMGSAAAQQIGYNVRPMNRRYDLHSHSLASDGTLSPTALVQRAATAGVDVLALTDHDDTSGIAEAEQAAGEQGICLVPGVEVSVTWGRQTVHVVGLNIDTGHAPLQSGLARLREFRNWRAEEMGRRLAKHGIEGAYEGAVARAHGRILSRTHFAHFLAENGHAETVRAVFKSFLKPRKPGYVPGEWATMEEALSWINGAGGQAVIAHPARYAMTASKRRKLLGEFAELGGAGLEVVSGSHSRGDNFSMGQLAKNHKLLASAGSDFHGPENPWVELGRLQTLPEGCIAIWEGWQLGECGERRAAS